MCITRYRRFPYNGDFHISCHWQPHEYDDDPSDREMDDVDMRYYFDQDTDVTIPPTSTANLGPYA